MADTPIHQFLFDATAPAVRAARDAVVAYADSGKYVPRKEPVAYKVNESGWPCVVDSESFQTPRESPLDWTRALFLRPGKLSYVVAADVPALSAALAVVYEQARNDEGFGAALDPIFSNASPERRDDYLGHSYLSFVGSIIARMEATGATSDDDLLAIYQQRERAHFAPVLNGDLVVPVTLTDFGTEGRFELDQGIAIEQLTPEMQCARAPRALSTSSNPYLTATATHALVIEDIAIDNAPYANRVLGVLRGESPIAEREMAKVNRLIQCVHFVTGSLTGYNQVLVRPADWSDGWDFDLPAIWKVETVQRYPETPQRAPWNEKRQTLSDEHVRAIGAAYPRLAGAPKDVQLAARRSVRAMMRTNDEDRTLDATIGLEALLMNSNAELAYRMSIRAAAALCDEYRPDVIFALAKKVYDHRSKIAHGVVDPKPVFTHDGQQWRSAEIAPFLLNALLKSRLLSSPEWTKDNIEDRIIDALAAHGTTDIVDAER